DPRVGRRARVRPGARAGMSPTPPNATSAAPPPPPGHASAALAAAGAAVNVEPSSADILMVDDRPENLLALDAILTGVGGKRVRARSGTEALKRLLAQDFA